MKKVILFLILSLSFCTDAKAQWQALITTVVQQPCNNDGIVTVELLGYNPPYTISYYLNGITNTTHSNVHNSKDTLKYIPAYCTIWGGGMPYPYTYLDVNIVDSLGISTYTNITLTAPFDYTVTMTDAVCPNLYGIGALSFSTANTYSVEWGAAWQIPFAPVATGNPASLLAGNYDIRVTDVNSGCVVTSYSTQAWVNNISGISYSASIVPANCTNGSITLSSPTGGMAPYSYLWPNGSTASSVSGLATGYYSVVVTDAQGCWEPRYYLGVPQVVTLTVNPTVSNATCLQYDGSITAFTSGGTAPYTYTWSNGATGQTANNLASGAYQVMVTDAAGCLGDNGYAYIQVGANSPVTVTYTASTSLCTTATGSATLTPVGGTAPYNVSWATSPAANGLTVSNLSVGTYYFNVTDAVGCVRSGSVYIPPASSISANINAINPVCPALNGNVYANVSGTAPPFTYSWNTGATTSNIINTPIGYYTCVITDAQQCSVTKSGSVYQTSPVHINMASIPTSCLFASDGQAYAAVTGGTMPYNYSWSNGQTGATSTSLTTGYYYVSVSDVNGCSNSNSTFVNYNPSNTSCYCTIYGTTYNDANANCSKDPGETGIPNQMIHCPPYGFLYTNANGDYSFNVPTGTYTVTENINGSYLLSVCQSSSAVASVVASTGCSYQINFSNLIIPVHDIQIITTSANTPPVVGNPYTQRLIIQNNGTVNESNIQVGYKHDGQLLYNSNNPVYLTQQNSSMYPNWFSQNTIPSLAPNSSTIIDVSYNVPTNIPIGTTISFYDTATYTNPILTSWLNDFTPWDNVNSFQTQVVAAFDPNYKEVSPKGFGSQGLISPIDTILTFVVHFQNEGSYFAQNITVIDTLDNDLDWNSLKPGYSDHSFVASISENGVLKYQFSNINLPWKNQYGNSLSSGLFTYTIKTKRNLSIGTTFVNGAAIYFDYNAPVITNKTLNTLGNASVGIKNSTKTVFDEIIVYPNPTNYILNIVDEQNQLQKTTIQITNYLGQVVFTSPFTKQINLSHLSAGMYFLILQDKENRRTVKIIKE